MKDSKKPNKYEEKFKIESSFDDAMGKILKYDPSKDPKKPSKPKKEGVI